MFMSRVHLAYMYLSSETFYRHVLAYMYLSNETFYRHVYT